MFILFQHYRNNLQLRTLSSLQARFSFVMVHAYICGFLIAYLSSRGMRCFPNKRALPLAHAGLPVKEHFVSSEQSINLF